ncbi:MAG: hypothetical protein HEEMFOPI_00081 [Holosporales bacterium]
MNTIFFNVVDGLASFCSSLMGDKINMDDLKNYVKRFIVGMSVLFFILFTYSAYVYFKDGKKEDDVVDEFVLKKVFKNVTFKNLDVYSASKHKKVTLQGPLNVYGSLHTEQSNYRDANIYGSLVATNSKFQDINVYGAANLNKVVVRDIEVYGAFEGEDIAVLNDLFIAGFGFIKRSKVNYCELLGDRLTLSGTSIKKLKITNTEKKKAVVYLEDGSIETVVFDSIPGEVITFGNAKVESVKGGTVIKSKDPFVMPQNDKIILKNTAIALP